MLPQWGRPGSSGATRSLSPFSTWLRPQTHAWAATAYRVRISSPKQPVYRINPGFIKQVTTDLFDIRDKRLLGMEQENLAILTVHTAQEQYVLINQNNEWVLERAPAQRLNQDRVALFVSRLIDVPAEIQIALQETNLARFGLDKPAATFTAINHQGEAKGRLVLGTHEHGLVYAMGSGIPGVYQARSMILTQIPSLAQLLVSEE